MKIEAPSENKIIVDLTRQDMAQLDITYEDMDYANIETRRVIWTLLDKAGRELGLDIDPTGRLMIEAIPKVSGGCIVHFTLLQPDAVQQHAQKPLLKKEEAVFTYEFCGFDALLCASENYVQMRFPAVSSALYRQNDTFRLILGVREGNRRIKHFFGEFATLRREGAAAVQATREHWQCVLAAQALEQLGAKH